jgi:hypothetical protein
LHHVIQGRLDMPLGLGIQRRSGLVEDQQRRVFQQRPGNRQALALAAGQQYAVLADFGIEALRQLVDELLGIGIGRGGFDVCAARRPDRRRRCCWPRCR